MIILHIMGHLGADPEMRYTTKGQKVWTLRVASKSRKGGQEETIWWRITIWGDAYDKMLAHFKKGSGIYIIAEMSKLEMYTDKNGEKQVSYEATAKSIHFPPFSDRNNEESGEERRSAAAQAPAAGKYSSSSENPYTHQIASGSRAESFDDDEPMPF